MVCRQQQRGQQGFYSEKGRAERHLGSGCEQSGAVEEKKKNLASHNRNVSVWKVATQDQEEANKRV